MEDENFKLLKDRIKELAKLNGKSLNDIRIFWKLKSHPGLDKRIESKNFPYSKSIHDLADFLNCSIDDILQQSQPKSQPEVSDDQVNDVIESYYKTNQNLDDKTLLHVMKSENLLLKQIIERMEKEIEFLRGQLTK